MSHRWSGWPGAWCLDCGAPDPAEACMSSEPHGAPEIVEYTVGKIVATREQECTVHPSTNCPEPESKRHDPYAATR